MDQPTRLYTTQFWLLCLSHALFAASFTMIIPELPAYLTALGGEDYKGLIIALFTLTAGLSRPFSGKLSDTVGRIPIMVVGTLVCVFCSLLYPFLTTVWGFLVLRFFHGFSTGFKPTATTAYVADMVPVHRRGEAMGILGVSMNVGASASPPIGSWFANLYGLDFMFYASSGSALISILILLGLIETLRNKRKFTPALLRLSSNEIIDRMAIPPAVCTALVYFCYGAMLTIVPDQTEYLGMSNKGLYFSTFTAASILSRVVAGRVSDRYGRVIVIKTSVLLLCASLVLMGTAQTPFILLLASGFIGFSTGIASPSIFAWTIDRSDEDRRGRSMATVYIALEIGIGTGALLSAFLYDNQPGNFALAFYVTAAICGFAFIYLQWIFKPLFKGSSL